MVAELSESIQEEEESVEQEYKQEEPIAVKAQSTEPQTAEEAAILAASLWATPASPVKNEF